MDYSLYSKNLSNSCCVPGAYNGFNLYKANPFDPRAIPRQPNQWCSNELIMRDKDLRCQARIQPLDIELDAALKVSKQDAVSKGLWK
tara:strand:- start:1072 stop:1332 length:261 start_codon:yes stop_codon:yes gene_type:complete